MTYSRRRAPAGRTLSTLGELLERTVRRHVDPEARVTGIELLPGGAQGFSGGTLRYYSVSYEASHGQPATVRLVTKEAPLLERQVLAYLSDQAYACVPYAYSLDLSTDRPLSRPAGMGQPPPDPTVLDLDADASMLVCMQYLSGGEDPIAPDIVTKAAQGLAAIHHANLGRAAELDWLPPADRSYYEAYAMGEVWRAYWHDTLQIDLFARKYGHLTKRLEAAAERLIELTNALWEEGTSLTLVHADMQGAHVMVHDGQPYFIDWGQARYGSFYIDLPNYFTPESAMQYRDALARLGHEIPRGEFLERYHEAGRYVGFKYLSACLWAWRELEPRYDDSRLRLIEVALNGGYGLART